MPLWLRAALIAIIAVTGFYFSHQYIYQAKEQCSVGDEIMSLFMGLLVIGASVGGVVALW